MRPMPPPGTTSQPPPDGPSLLRLDASRASDQAVDMLLTGAGWAEAPARVIDVTGAGAVECLQGLVSCDVEARGERGVLYGAVLTRFGMITADFWMMRDDDAIRIVVPKAGAEALVGVLRRSLPPRLARATERADIGVLRLVGPRAVATLEAAGLNVPEPGTTGSDSLDGERVRIAHAPPGAPFAIQLLTATPSALGERLRALGAVEMSSDLLEVARILAGWPAVGFEIDAKTLPQEVRYDEIAGVSYTKGCFVGQETVARVHFRGHPNRGLLGLLFEREPQAETVVSSAGREVGRVTAQVWLGPRHRWVGLAVLRRDVESGSTVLAAGVMATVVPLPFAYEMV